MKNIFKITFLLLTVFSFGCLQQNNSDSISAEDILGNPDYLAFSYGGYRYKTRYNVPTVDELKDDMKILSAMGIKLLRTYNTKQYRHAANLLKAIKELKDEDSSFEMYVMLGTWIECEGAWTGEANHNAGNVKNNTTEIEAAIEMANTYPDIVKMITVGNEAMVQWAVNYFVYPNVILKWVNHLQELKKTGGIPSNIWITSSDNYESWGGGVKSYQTEDLTALIKAVDFVSLHTYPFHDSHYSPTFWGVPEDEEKLSAIEKSDAAMLRAKNYAISQYQGAADYIAELEIDKPIHIGETGWATIASSSYGKTGSQAADEYKEKSYYQHMRDWTNKASMSCFYFEAFDEQWKDQGNALGSENHFGLINLKGEAKYVLWDAVDQGIFEGLTRGGLPITKTYNGDEAKMMADLLVPPLTSEMGLLEINTVNDNYNSGELITEENYVIVHESLNPKTSSKSTFPSAKLKLNSWEGTCVIEMSAEGIIEIITGTGAWWGCALEMQTGGIGENLSNFKNGTLNFEIKGTTQSSFNVGFQTGYFAKVNQVNNYIAFGADDQYVLKEDWSKYSISVSKLLKQGILTDVNGPLFLLGDKNFDGKNILIKNVYYSQK